MNIFTIINLTLLGALLFFKKNSSITNKILGLIVFIPATPFFVNYLLYTGVLFRFPLLMFLCLSFLWAPLVYIYIQLMLGQEVKFQKKILVHAIPYLLYVICLFCLYIQDDIYRNDFFNKVFNGKFPWQLAIINIILLFQSLFYLVYSYIKLKVYVKNFIGNGSDERSIIAKVKWLKFFLQIFLVLPFLAILANIIFPMKEVAYIYDPLIYDIAFYTVIYGAIRNSTIFSTSEFQQYVIAEKENREKYSNSNLQPDRSIEIYYALQRCLDIEKLYLNSELTLTQLSLHINISPHQLSQVINQNFKKSFFDLINSYRVEEAKLKIKVIEQSKLTIEGIGTECGFGSPTSFYRAFKKNTGLTPSQFQKQN